MCSRCLLDRCLARRINAVPVVIFIFYVLGSLEPIAKETEDPFGKDTNDLPMQRMCENIQRNVEEILLLKVICNAFPVQ